MTTAILALMAETPISFPPVQMKLQGEAATQMTENQRLKGECNWPTTGSHPFNREANASKTIL